MKEAYEFLLLGGPVIYPIALCSLIALTIFLERLWVLQRSRVLPDGFSKRLTRLLREGRWERAQALCEGNNSAFARVVGAALKHRGRRREIVKEVVQETGAREVTRLERFVGALGAIASITPLLGLLGTVTGMIGVFRTVVAEVQASGEVNPGSLANGIWEALVSTASGLTVAIPAFVMFKYLMSRIDRLTVEMEERSMLLVDHICDPDDSPVFKANLLDHEAAEGRTAGARAEGATARAEGATAPAPATPAPAAATSAAREDMV